MSENNKVEEECKEFGLKQHVPVPVGLKFPKAFA